jgi:hypothetical protein
LRLRPPKQRASDLDVFACEHHFAFLGLTRAPGASNATPKYAIAIADTENRFRSSSQADSCASAHFPVESGATSADPEDFRTTPHHSVCSVECFERAFNQRSVIDDAGVDEINNRASEKKAD